MATTNTSQADALLVLVGMQGRSGLGGRLVLCYASLSHPAQLLGFATRAWHWKDAGALGCGDGGRTGDSSNPSPNVSKRVPTPLPMYMSVAKLPHNDWKHQRSEESRAGTRPPSTSPNLSKSSKYSLPPTPQMSWLWGRRLLSGRIRGIARVMSQQPELSSKSHTTRRTVENRIMGGMAAGTCVA